MGSRKNPDIITFTPPEPHAPRQSVWPVFLPYQGCPQRCVFCAQEQQSGEKQAPLQSAYARLESDLAVAHGEGRTPLGLAFFGGTFTSLPPAWQIRFLQLAQSYREKGLITHIRCSTRPDSVTKDGLAVLKNHGLDMVELGVQSFQDAPLASARRGYSGRTARSGCDIVLSAGLELGLQLMPGMPGMRIRHFQADVEQAAKTGAVCARLYPCLVIEGAPLADIWRKGAFSPWGLNATTSILAKALLKLWDANIRVIRIGLAPEPELKQNLLAGPWSEDFGGRVKSLALFLFLRAQLRPIPRPLLSLSIPQKYQGQFWGRRSFFAPHYQRLGLPPTHIHYHEREHFLVQLSA